jgi:hypothetical protein
MALALQTHWSRAELLGLPLQEMVGWADVLCDLKGIKRITSDEAPVDDPRTLVLTEAERRAIAAASEAG